MGFLEVTYPLIFLSGLSFLGGIAYGYQLNQVNFSNPLILDLVSCSLPKILRRRLSYLFHSFLSVLAFLI
jgi:hypothetical protein